MQASNFSSGVSNTLSVRSFIPKTENSYANRAMHITTPLRARYLPHRRPAMALIIIKMIAGNNQKAINPPYVFLPLGSGFKYMVVCVPISRSHKCFLEKRMKLCAFSQSAVLATGVRTYRFWVPLRKAQDPWHSVTTASCAWCVRTMRAVLNKRYIKIPAKIATTSNPMPKPSGDLLNKFSMKPDAPSGFYH